MIDRHHPNPAEQAELTEQDLAVATSSAATSSGGRPGERHARTTYLPSPPSSATRP